MYSLLLAVIYLSFISLGLPDALLGSAPGYRPTSIRIAPTLVVRDSVADVR